MKQLITWIAALLFSTITLAADKPNSPIETPLNTPLTSGFDHIGLTVKDLDASTHFFIDVLGWKRAGGDPRYPANFVTDGKMFLTLWAVQDTKNLTEFNRKSNVGLHHLAITISSFKLLEKIYQRAKAHPGVVIEFAPELAYGGPAKHMMLREPSGNRLEFKHAPGKQH